jgi:hypothetical protein
MFASMARYPKRVPRVTAHQFSLTSAIGGQAPE